MKVALVTGAGAGIGRAIARRLSAEGFVVAVADVDPGRAEAVMSEIEAIGRDARAFEVDIGEEDSIRGMFAALADAFGDLAVLINNAGVRYAYSAEDCPPAEFDACMAVNLRGHYLCAKHALPLLKAGIGSNIVNIASTHAVRTQPRYFPYNVAKAGVIAMTRSMAIDLGPYGIRVNAVCPGLIHTPMLDATPFGKDQRFLEWARAFQPLGRLGEPEDVANAVAFLASDQASFIHGEALTVDGGRNALVYPSQDS